MEEPAAGRRDGAGRGFGGADPISVAAEERK